jgi:N-acetylglutamate synthase-like GNAT family acetyltransferase
MDFRRATQRDVERIGSLLAESGLPALPRSVPLSNVVVALDGDAAVGGIALEVRGRSGLLRSAVVAPGRRREGIGSSLVRSIVARANELGLRDLYLLTELALDGARVFESAGFLPIARSELPPEIRSTREYREQCPETARAMRCPLATRW